MARHKFNYDSIRSFESFRNLYVNDKYECYFMCSMIGTCEPLFDNLNDNYEVEEKLYEHKVIGPEDFADSESCSLVINFTSYVNANRFIDRLNKYLAKKKKKIEDASSY